jgi:hypothetical protein
LFKDLKVPRREISDLIAASPSVAEAFIKLYRNWGERKSREENSLSAMIGDNEVA